MVIGVNNPSAFQNLIQVLKKCGIAIMPCDTIYGIVGIVPDTEKKIRIIKEREANKPFIRLLDSTTWLQDITATDLPDSLREFWPGPLTLIFPAKRGGTVALRVPRDPLLLKTLEEVGKPLFSTSVNLCGREAMWRIKDIVRVFRKKVDLILDAGDLPGSASSTILDITSKPFRIVRQGALSLPEELFKVGK